MDSNTSISSAQKIISCDLCDNSIQHFCNRSQVSLCEECINKLVKKDKAITHDSDPFKHGEIRIIFPECEFHPSHWCEGQCKLCDVPVCMKCVITSHNGHTMIDIADIFNDKKKEIQKETKEIESDLLPKCMKKNEDTEGEITKTMGKYIELEKEKEKQRKFWHQEVDDILNQLSSMTQSKKDEHLDDLKSHQAKLRDLIADMNKTVKENQEMLQSNKVSQVTNFNSRLKEYRDIFLKLLMFSFLC
ncbi:E3 ubiquitin-protein ligase TRIM45-like [Saccostrea cucullata]|uniref:E3 ubiquitin-protein ligase TRIM45-like n=1 Tax=Saccostrea cuccullata TaxID=36930 RepID=UPI002ED0E11A